MPPKPDTACADAFPLGLDDDVWTLSEEPRKSKVYGKEAFAELGCPVAFAETLRYAPSGTKMRSANTGARVDKPQSIKAMGRSNFIGPPTGHIVLRLWRPP